MENQEFKFCTQCGAKMKKEARFCTACGAPFKDTEESKEGTKKVLQDPQQTPPLDRESGAVKEQKTKPYVQNKKKSRAMIFIALGAVLVIVAAVALFLFHFSSKGYDNDLVGTGELIRSVEGLSKLDETDTDEIIEAINEKYGKVEIKTLDLSMDGELAANISDSASGISMDMGGSAQGQIKLDFDEDLFELTLSGNANLFGINMPIDIAVYQNEGRLYSNTNILGEESGWIVEETGYSDEDKLFIEIDRKHVMAAYQNEETGDYVLELDFLVADLVEDAASGLAGIDDSSMYYSNAKTYVTLDEGLGIIGAFIDMRDCLLPEEGFSIDSFYLMGVFNSMNEDVAISIPYESIEADAAQSGSSEASEADMEESFAELETETETAPAFETQAAVQESSDSVDFGYTTMFVVNCNESITLRTSPSTDTSAIRQIPLGEPVSFIEPAANGFYMISYMGDTGYALASYLSTGDGSFVEGGYRTLRVVNCNESITLRTEPSTSAAEIRQIPLGATLSYIETAENGFYKVTYLSDTGYALASYLEFV